MFCSHCGKELADEAVMCPNCGTPTKNMTVNKLQSPKDAHSTGISAVVLTLSIIAFVTGIVFGAFFYVYRNAVLLLYVISAVTILPALVSLSLGIYLLSTSAKSGNAKAMSVVAVTLSAIVLTFLFISGCIIVAQYFI